MRQVRKKIMVLHMEVCVLFGLVCILFVVLVCGKNKGSADVSAKISETVQNREQPSREPQTDETSVLKEEAQKIYRENKELLLLVNKENQVPDNFESDLMNICEGRLQASQWMYEDLKDMLNDAEENGGYTFFIASAYRSKEKQQYLVDEDVEAFMNQGMSRENALAETLKETMPAGYSEHQTGLALDILSSKNLEMDQSQATDDGNRWLRRHCAEYGFILRYPEDKEDITLISYEPWHFRYVGKEAAKFITENKLTLEEFIELIE